MNLIRPSESYQREKNSDPTYEDSFKHNHASLRCLSVDLNVSDSLKLYKSFRQVALHVGFPIFVVGLVDWIQSGEGVIRKTYQRPFFGQFSLSVCFVFLLL